MEAASKQAEEDRKFFRALGYIAGISSAIGFTYSIYALSNGEWEWRVPLIILLSLTSLSPQFGWLLRFCRDKLGIPYCIGRIAVLSVFFLTVALLVLTFFLVIG